MDEAGKSGYARGVRKAHTLRFMKDKKLERALYGPGLFEVTLGAVLSIALGAVAGVAYLLYKPVETVKTLPKEAERIPGQIYFVEGSKETGKAKQWRTKRKQLAESVPGEIAFIEDELNAWFAPEAPAAKPAAKPVPGAPPEPPAEVPIPDELVTWSHPSFRIADNAVQVSGTATFNPLHMLSLNVPLIVQASGGFEKVGDEFVYAPKTLFVGSLPVHRIPGATRYLMERARASQALPEQGMEAWKKVASVTVDGRVLKVTIQ
jgi:hypothetical protein